MSATALSAATNLYADIQEKKSSANQRSSTPSLQLEQQQSLLANKKCHLKKSSLLIARQVPTQYDDASDNLQQDENSVVQQKDKKAAAEEAKAKVHATYGNDKKYVVDPSLPGLAKHFRMLGVDCDINASYSDDYILFLQRSEGRVIITRSSKLLTRITQFHNRNKKYERQRNELLVKYNTLLAQQQQNASSNNAEDKDEDLEQDIADLKEEIDSLSEDIFWYDFYFVKSTGRHMQIREVVDHFHIRYFPQLLFSRCSECGHFVEVIADKQSIKNEIHSNTYDENDFFSRCTSCRKIFWGTMPGNVKQRRYYDKSVEFAQEYCYKETSSSSASSSTSASSSEEGSNTN